jgi:hypothetical protein
MNEDDFRAREHEPAPKRSGASANGIVDLPVACTLSPETIATRKAGLLPGLAAKADNCEGRADGIRLRFRSDALSAIMETVDAERRCCRFLRFDITVEPDGGPIWLELTGPPGTQSFLSALLEM